MSSEGRLKSKGCAEGNLDDPGHSRQKGRILVRMARYEEEKIWAEKQS